MNQEIGIDLKYSQQEQEDKWSLSTKYNFLKNKIFNKLSLG